MQRRAERNMGVPLITSAWVTGYDPVNRGVFVILPDGQTIGSSVQVLSHGPSDPFAKEMPELPRRGTRGLVLFPDRDSRNGVWLGSYDPNLNNAVTSDSSHPFENYFAHWAGDFSFEDQSGQCSRYFTDGSYLQIGSTTTLPTLYRNQYDSSTGKVNRTEYTLAQRNPNPQPAFNFYFKHSSGTSFSIDSSGNVAVSGAASAVFAVTFEGTTIAIDDSGNVVITLAGGAVFEINNTSDALALVSKLVSTFNAHAHKNVTSGTGVSGTPLKQIIATDIESTLAKTSG